MDRILISARSEGATRPGNRLLRDPRFATCDAVRTPRWVAKAGLAFAAFVLSVLVAVLFVVSSHGDVGAATRAAETASPTFCQDDLELQNWIAQNEQPGLDQYQDGEANPQVLPYATYLEKLTREAPVEIQPALTTWANFVKEVGDTVDSPAVSAQAPAATAAQASVQKWFTTQSGCALSYINHPASSFQFPFWGWIIIGIVAVFLLVALANRLFSSRGTPVPVGGGGTGGSQGTGSYAWSQRPAEEACELCKNDPWGPGRILCRTCNGTGRSPMGELCPTCHGNQFQTCPYCNGTGVKR